MESGRRLVQGSEHVNVDPFQVIEKFVQKRLNKSLEIQHIGLKFGVF